MDTVKPGRAHDPAPKGIRLARALATLGADSRRGSEALIRAGRVAVNGARVEDVTRNVIPNLDAITLDGKLLSWPRGRHYYALHKPRGIVSTVRDPHADRTVVQLIPTTSRLYPVGRLDKDSEGLILLTDDGDFANRVTHPRYQVEKEYRAQVFPDPTDEMLARIGEGFELDGKLARPERVQRELRAGEPWVTMVLMEGRKHEVRRILGMVGLSVRRLIRTRIGRVRLGDLAPGRYRELHPQEIAGLLGAQPDRSRPLHRSPDHVAPKRAARAGPPVARRVVTRRVVQ